MNVAKTLGITAAAGAVLASAAWMASSFLPDNQSQARVAPPVARPAPVIAAPVRFEPERLELDAVGTSRAIRSVAIYPEAAGEVVAVNFSAGQAVAPGDVLVELDSRDERLALELAEVRLADAQRLMDRYGRARGSDAIPVNDLQAAETALAAARIERDRARVALDNRFVRAPFAGVVGLTEIDPGDRIGPADEITTLDDRSSLLVSFEVPELLLDALRLGEAVEVSTWNQRGQGMNGELVGLGSRIDPVTRAVEARARVPNEEDRLRPGMSFRVALRLAGAAYPTVPEVAVQWGATGAYVWRVEDGRARRVPVDIVQRREGRVLLDGRLAAGDEIVVEGIQSVREGRSVAPTGESAT